MIKYSVKKQIAKFGKHKGKEVQTAQCVLTGKVSFIDLCRMVADNTTIGAGEVKAMVYDMAKVVARELARGYSVDCGELGIFRPTLKSSQLATDEGEFRVQNVKSVNVVFRPRAAIAGACAGCNLERVDSHQKGCCEEEEEAGCKIDKKDETDKKEKPGGILVEGL